MAALASTVYVRDPDSNQTVVLHPGTTPEPRLAALVTNPAAWVDGKLPRLPKAKTEPDGSAGPTGDGQDDASGDDSASGDADSTTKQAAPAAKKTAAKKATAPARGRAAAGEGDSGE
jgi:hypothetical protein